MRELLVREWTDERCEVLDDLAGLREGARKRWPLLRRCVDILSHAPAIRAESTGRLAKRILAEWRGGDDHQVDSNWMRFAPPSTYATVREGGLIDHDAVCDDGAGGRGGDAPTYGRFVAGMVDAGKPVACSIRPIVAEASPASGAIGANDEPILHGSMVCDLDTHRILAIGSKWNVHFVLRTRERHPRSVETHAIDCELNEIEYERVHACGMSHLEYGVPANHI